jgi:glycosyltransferase involved in cell wall biosynthesis
MVHSGLLLVEKKIKIIRLITRLNNGGPAKHVTWLTSGLNNRQFEPILVSGVIESNEDSIHGYAHNNKVYPVFIPEMARSISLVKDLIALMKIIRLLFKEKPDIIHTHTSKAGFIGRAASIMYRFFYTCYVVHTYHGHTFHSYFGPLKEKIFLLIEKLLAIIVTDRIVVLSDKQFHEIHGKFGLGRKEQFEIIPLGIQMGDLNISIQEKKSFRKEFNLNRHITIGIVGRIAPIKNHKMLIDAAGEIVKQGIDNKVKFVVIGSGSKKDMSELKNYTQIKNLCDHVIFTGNRYDVGNFFQNIDVFAITSRNEGTPLSLIEGMAAGKPFVATDVGGIKDLTAGNVDVKDNGYIRIYKNCILVDSEDTASFAKAITMLVEDKDLRTQMGKEGREFVRVKHSKERLIKDMENLYLSLFFGDYYHQERVNF